MAEALFAFEDVVVERGGRRLLGGVSCAMPTGGVTVVAGPSGAGKSTLLRLCNRLEVPTAGLVRYRGSDLSASDPRRHRREVGMVFQLPTVLPGSVADNLRAAVPGMSDDVLAAALDAVGLGGFGWRAADRLSGGEAQRMCLARTLSTEPSVVLMDEPSSALDPASTALIEQLVDALVVDGTSVVWVTHDLAQLRRVADHVVVLARGRVLQAGPVGDVLARPLPGVERFLAAAA